MKGTILHKPTNDATTDSLIELSNFDSARVQQIPTPEGEADLWGIGFFERIEVEEIDGVFQHYEEIFTLIQEQTPEATERREAAVQGLTALEGLQTALDKIDGLPEVIRPYVLVFFIPLNSQSAAMQAFKDLAKMQAKTDRDSLFLEIKSY